MLIKDKKTLQVLKERYGADTLKKNINEAFFNRYKENPYKDDINTLKDNMSLYHIRQRLEEIWRNCNTKDIDIATKQCKRLYKLVDNMINQGYIIEK